MSIWHFAAWGNMALKNSLEIRVWGESGESRQLKVMQQ